MSYQKIIILGNLGDDVKQTFTPAGIAIAKFSVATSKKWKDQQGNAQEKTSWHRVVAFKKTAELCSQYLKKGSQVMIEGELQYGSYDKNGVTMYTTDVVAQNVQFIGSRTDKPQQPQQQQQQAYQPQQQQAYTQEDIPF
ncbi:MAG: single-stranded DNA-binding protein [Bacteroidetes bacterium]|nr:MAG: single-stranded DNA-binding protein [Bacteroidota bacterium]